jgi:hypothetical protein
VRRPVGAPSARETKEDGEEAYGQVDAEGHVAEDAALEARIDSLAKQLRLLLTILLGAMLKEMK